MKIYTQNVWIDAGGFSLIRRDFITTSHLHLNEKNI
jgi:hypothetical protein